MTSAIKAKWQTCFAIGIVAWATLVGAMTAHAALIGQWTFDDGAATDTSGNGHNGTLLGNAEIVNDPIRGSVLSLTGGGGKVDLGNPEGLNVLGEFSAAAWVNPAELPQTQANAGILQRGHQGGPNREFVLRVGISGSSYQFGTWSPNMHTTFLAPPEDVGNWVHLAGTMTDAGGGLFTYRLYRNGEEVAMLEGGPGMLGDYTVGWAIGARGGLAETDFQRVFNGLIDEVQMFDHALSPAEVIDIMTLGPPPILGDTNGNMVGGEYPDDFLPIQMNFRQLVSTREEGDLVRNGTVDFDDFHEWKAAFLGNGGSLADVDLTFFPTVPEPTSGLLLLIGSVALVCYRSGMRRA